MLKHSDSKIYKLDGEQGGTYFVCKFLCNDDGLRFSNMFLLQAFQWKCTCKFSRTDPSFAHLPLRSSEQIVLRSASDSVTFHTGEPKGGSPLWRRRLRGFSVWLSSSSIQRDTLITPPPPSTSFPERTHLLEKQFAAAIFFTLLRFLPPPHSFSDGASY